MGESVELVVKRGQSSKTGSDALLDSSMVGPVLAVSTVRIRRKRSRLGVLSSGCWRVEHAASVSKRLETDASDASERGGGLVRVVVVGRVVAERGVDGLVGLEVRVWREQRESERSDERLAVMAERLHVRLVVGG